MAVRWTYFLLVVFAVAVIGATAGGGGGDWRKGRRNRDDSSSSEEDCWDPDHYRGGDGRHHGKHDHDDDDHWRWTAGAGMGVLIVIICVILGLLSLVSWLSCKIYSKCRARKVCGLKGAIVPSSSPPSWACSLMYQPDLSVGFGLVSDGLARVGPAHLVRKRQGTRVTDGASWAVPITKGKHVFEITWPWGNRGSHASVGVGTSEAPLKMKGSHPLVGSNDHTWGLDIVSRKIRHANRTVTLCPTDGSFVPDKFLMYVDVDEGIMGFGNEVTYWGDVITDLPKQGSKPLYVMAGATRWQAELSVQYMGSAADGENDMEKVNPPHHLPPMPFRVPPTYTEVEETAGPIMTKPTNPIGYRGPQTLDPTTPPPPYMHTPVGCAPVDDTKDNSDLV